MSRYLLGLLASLPLMSATLDIYSDRAFYTYAPQNRFIGFAKNVDAQNLQGSFLLAQEGACPANDPLCKHFDAIKTLEAKLDTLNQEEHIIATLLEKQHIQSVIDADKAINVAQKLSAHLSTLHQENRKLQHQLQIKQSEFNAKTTSPAPLFFTTLPSSDVTLTLLGIGFYSDYTLNADQSTLVQDIVLQNRSGIALDATEVRLFERQSAGISKPFLFYPRFISTYNEQPRYKAISMARNDMLMESSAPAPALHVSKEASRSYRIANVNLPSDGAKKRSQVSRETLSLSQELCWHPYESDTVYNVLRFTPKAPIEASYLSLVYHGKRIEKAPFRKEKGALLVNAAIEYDLEVSRKPISEFSESKGIFGSDREKKEGYTLFMTNRSKTAKTLHITERIPLSTQEEISVALTDFKGEAQYDYDKSNGKLQINVDLKPNESKELRYVYAIRYPEKMQIRY